MDSPVSRRFSFLTGNDGLASLVDMEIDSPPRNQNQKNSNFLTRPLNYARNSYRNLTSLFTISPPSESATIHDLRKPIIAEACCRCRKRFQSNKDIFMYSDRQYCSAECRQVQLDIDFPPPKEDKDGKPSSPMTASRKRKPTAAPIS